MPAAAAARVRRRLDQRARPSRRIGVTVLALAAAGAGAWLIARPQASSERSSSFVDGVEADGVETIVRSPDLQLSVDARHAVLHVDRGSCTLRVRDWGTVSLRAGSSLRRADDGLELSSGAADFAVDKRAPANGSTFVHVPQGSIEITGTRFSMIQSERVGSVHLDEGSIRFHAPDGRTVALVPGQSLAWPLPAEVAAAVETAPAARDTTVNPVTAAQRKVPSSQPGTDRGGLVEQIAKLRAEGRYQELVEALGAAIGRERRALMRERLSFELGAVLTYHLVANERACTHWAAHDRAFPGGHYAEEVADARKHLHCDREGGSR
jgi:hypothetical protein